MEVTQSCFIAPKEVMLLRRFPKEEEDRNRYPLTHPLSKVLVSTLELHHSAGCPYSLSTVAIRMQTFRHQTPGYVRYSMLPTHPSHLPVGPFAHTSPMRSVSKQVADFDLACTGTNLTSPAFTGLTTSP